MKFAHIADCHVGSWRDPVLKEINHEYFSNVIDNCVTEKVDCVLIAGDLFNTAVPSIDSLKLVTEKLKLLAENDIHVFGIAGSHDYSASGKSMLDVLSKAGLFTPVIQGKVIDGKMQLQPVKGPKGITFSGLAGRRGSLEKDSYKTTDYSLIEKEDKLIFLFHTTIQEYAPKKELQGVSFQTLPKNAIYYAGGHIHYHFDTKTLTSTLAYPGPTCPNTFAEWEDLKGGSYIIGTAENNAISIQRKYVTTYPVKAISYDITDKNAVEIQEELLKLVSNHTNAILLLRLTGKKTGSLSDINFQKIESHAKNTGAKCFLKNSIGLQKEEQTIDEKPVTDIQETELQKINEHIEHTSLLDKQFSEITNDKQEKLITSLMTALASEKQEGETTTDFDERIISNVTKHLEHEL